MILNTIIFVIVILLVLRRPKVGVIFLSITSVWLCMWRTPISGSIYVISSVLSIMLACFKYGGKLFSIYPFKFIIVLPFVSLIVTNIVNGFDLYPILKISVEYLLPVVLYYVLSNYDMLVKFIRILAVFLVFLIIYTVYEEITVSNPIMEWCEAHGENFYWLTSHTEIRFGFRRAQSFLLYCSALGGICNFSFFIIGYLKIKNSPLVSKKKYSYLLYVLPVCSFLTGTRSVYIPLMIMAIAFLKWEYIRQYILRYVMIVVFFITVMAPYFGAIYDSVANSNESEEVRGSSANLREKQFAIATYYMEQSPIVGHGTHYLSVVQEKDADIFGAESIWMPLMIEQGILGCVCTAMVFVYMFYYLYKNKYYQLMLVMLAFVVGKTISSMLGIGEGFYFVIMVFLLRCHELGAVPNDKREKYIE